MGSAEQPSIPSIDFSTWTSPQNIPHEERLKTARELVEACHNTDFVYITNHGVSSETLAKAFSTAEEFFALPMEKKMSAANRGVMSFRGYSWPGLENAAGISDAVTEDEKKVSEGTVSQESYALGSDEFTHDLNVWPPPTLVPGFQTFLTGFYWECWRTTELILRAISLGLNLPSEEYLLDLHTGHENEISLRHYPPVSAKILERKEGRRLAAHSDFDSLTLLFQDDCGGLAVEKMGERGTFVPVEPREGTLVMNIGDALERWSNGLSFNPFEEGSNGELTWADHLKSTKHRVHLPPLEDRYTGEERMTRQRYSIPYFVSPKYETMLECLPGCSSADNPPKYEPMVYHEWLKVQAAKVFG